MKKSALTYDAAWAELQSILQALQNDQVKMDDLAATLARANELIEFCRQRLRDTEYEIQKLNP